MDPHATTGRPRPVLLSFRFLGTSLVGSLAMAVVSIFAPPPAQVAALGACVSVLAGLFLAYLEQEDVRECRRESLLRQLLTPLRLAPEHELFDQYRAFAGALSALADQPDPVLRRFAMLKLSAIAGQLGSLAHGKIVFHATESWRTVYEQVLESPPLTCYRSVSWVKTRDYWQDPPGRQSLRLNYDLVRRGLRIRRIVVLRGDLWPADERLPALAVRPWIEQQHAHGIELSLVRESDLGCEPELLADFGVYGGRAVGVQELDEQARTVRFLLDFDPQAVRLALDRWERIAIYATPYAELWEPPLPDGTPDHPGTPAKRRAD